MKAPQKHIRLNPKSVSSVYHQVLTWDKRINLVFGSASSGKSFTTYLYCLVWAMQGRNILICRQTLASMTDSTWADLKGHINDYDLEEFFTVKESERKIECTNGNRGIIILKGLEHPERIKSIRGKKPIDTVIVDEATEISESTFNQLMIRQRGQSEFPKRIFLIFNPVHTGHWIYKRFFEAIERDGLWNNRYYQEENLQILKTTYRDNEFLSEDDKVTFLMVAEKSPYHKDVYCDGNWGSLGNKIFSNYRVIEPLPIDHSDGWVIRIGSDLGWTDPSICSIIGYHKRQKKLRIYDSCGSANLLPESFTVLVQQMLSRNNLPLQSLIIADSEDPRFIRQCRSCGLNIAGATKGSVLSSYLWMMQLDIEVCENATHIVSDIKNAEWTKDKSGNSTDTPNHTFTHGIDGVRYATELFWLGAGKVIGTRGLY